ncbi:MAG TPA: hypothetical protein VIS96_04925 [Terrimicrobiaceae bacterium]
MKAHSLTLSVAAVAGALALFATPAEAGDCKKSRKHHHHDYYGRGWNDHGYYQRARYYEPRYYQPVRYAPAPVYYQRPAFQVGFVFGGGNGYGRCR